MHKYFKIVKYKKFHTRPRTSGSLFAVIIPRIEISYGSCLRNSKNPGWNTCNMFLLQVLTSIGNFCICSIAVGMILEIIVMFAIQQRAYRKGIDNLLVLLIGGIPIAMPTVLSVTLAIGSHRLSQQVQAFISTSCHMTNSI